MKLSTGVALSIAVTLCLQAGAIVLGARILADDNFLIHFYLFLIFPFAGVVGLVHAFFLYLLVRLTLPVAVLILSSLTMVTIIPPLEAARALSPSFSSMAKRSFARRAQGYTDSISAHHAALSETFQKPQRIRDVQYPYLLLESGHVLELFRMSLSKDEAKEFNDQARQTLVGKTVQVSLPEREVFLIRYYKSRPRVGFRHHEWPRNPKLKEPYGVIPALIHVDGVLINSRLGQGRPIQK